MTISSFFHALPATGEAAVTRMAPYPASGSQMRARSSPRGPSKASSLYPELLGQTTVSTDGSGKTSFTKALAKVSVDKTITATATSAGGDTSEFSLPRKVVSA